MDLRLNGWTVLLLVVAMLLGYGFAVFNMQVMAPAMVARAANNQVIASQLKTILDGNSKMIAEWSQGIEARLKAVESRK